MSKLIINPEYGLYERSGRAFTTSRQVSETFKKDHRHVLRDIAKITEPKSGLSERFVFSNFEASSYRDSSGKKNPEILLSKDGFSILTFGYGGTRAMAFKEAYINRFNQMEAFITSLVTAKMEHPAFTEAVMLAHDEPKHYHFSNEADMINRIVLGISAKQYREQRGILQGVSVRPFLNIAQIKAVETLQRVDIGLLAAGMDHEQRKAVLANHYERFKQRRITA